MEGARDPPEPGRDQGRWSVQLGGAGPAASGASRVEPARHHQESESGSLRRERAPQMVFHTQGGANWAPPQVNEAWYYCTRKRTFLPYFITYGGLPVNGGEVWGTIAEVGLDGAVGGVEVELSPYLTTSQGDEARHGRSPREAELGGPTSFPTSGGADKKQDERAGGDIRAVVIRTRGGDGYSTLSNKSAENR
ncbi:hypothetical protein JTE90_020546 [Oedothorax gibbosus]|uniref:Uncharacterized protein n=1 Tax=Oedothorax gibbosus TaxID=931172 RepID=A0AAV6VZC7_9ARAC|nr:hypothetical protein JTE90_020546 [Oedothorax gibbosus]